MARYTIFLLLRPENSRVGHNETIDIKWSLSGVSQPVVSGRDLNGASFIKTEIFG